MNYRRRERGGAAIAFILIAAVAAGAYIMRTTDLVKRGSERTAQVRINHQVDSIGKGFLNYTIYAIKERWCMDESWGRDYACGGGDMSKFIYHPRNLERFLWSKVALDGIRDRYIAKYNQSPPQEVGMMNLSYSVPVERLSQLGETHPLNLILPSSVRKCFSSLAIDIQRPLNSSNYLKGDEVALHIFSKFISSGDSSKTCERINGDISSEAFVIFFPRTLNQFGVIKVGDLDISKIKGAKKSAGVHFWGDTYVQGDLSIPSSGYAPVDFKGTVRLGNGVIKQGSKRYQVPMDGTVASKLHSGYSTFGGLLGGVGLDGEPDEGLSYLFEGAYVYPTNSLLGKCIPRLKIKNSPSETRHARLFAQGSGSNYTLAISSEDEFREYSYYGDNNTGYYIRQLPEETQNIKANFSGLSTADRPVLKLDVSAGRSLKTSLLIGRNTEVALDMFDREAYIAQNELDMNDSENEKVKELLENPAPRLKLKFSTDRANRIDFTYEWENPNSLVSKIYEDLRTVDLNFNAFDFAIEGSNNPVYGNRTARSHFPGPNDTRVDNRLSIVSTVERIGPRHDGNYVLKGIDLEDSTGKSVSSWLSSSLTEGWAPMKVGESTPPYDIVTVNGRLVREYILPGLGISLATSKELDDLCNFDASATVTPEWDISFTQNTKFSWLYNVTSPGISILDPSNVKPVDEYVFDAASMSPGTYQGVPTFSMAKRCVVPSNISLVFGMYVCEELVVKERKDPLNFIGTFVVRNIQLSATSVSKGVNFYSIWNSHAIDILQKRGDLVRKNKAPGDNKCVFDQPGWSPELDEAMVEDFQSCSPMKFIYYGANNFNWTTIDPEIGLPPSGAHNQTMSKVPNRYRRYTATIVWVK